MMMRRACQSTVDRRWRAELLALVLSLLLSMRMASLASRRMSCFTSTRTSLRRQQLHLHKSFRRESQQGTRMILLAMAEEAISLTDFMLETNLDKSEVESLAASIASATTDKLWDMTEFEPLGPDTSGKTPELPRYKRWMDGVQFQATARKLSPEVTDA